MADAASEIVGMDGLALAGAIRAGEVSCAEAMAAFLDHIERINPKVNAIVALRPREALMAEARAKDAERTAGAPLGALHGLPQAPKDLEAARGLPFTQGSPIFKDHVAQADSLMVARLRAAGAILIGKTNTPEFGKGSQTYNLVYGATRNPYDLGRTAGGSSGGAAAALACRMLPVADGSDYGGSLRNPAGWNNVYALRPNLGRTPTEAADAFSASFGVIGPMARTVEDLALLLGVQAGYDPRAPLSLPGDGSEFRAPLMPEARGKRIGWLGDFGGFAPCEPGVLETCRAALGVLEDLGCVVEDAQPDHALEPVWEALLKIRAWQAGGALQAHYQDPARRALLKPEAVWEIESGLALSAYDITAATAVRTNWAGAVRALFERFDFLAAPTAQVWPFAVETHWPAHIGGTAMATYHEWMKIQFLITLTGRPSLAMPAGFSEGGLPMGVQIVGPERGELACLRLGLVYDEATQWPKRRPPPLLG